MKVRSPLNDEVYIITGGLYRCQDDLEKALSELIAKKFFVLGHMLHESRHENKISHYILYSMIKNAR